MREKIVHLIHERIGDVGGIQQFDLRVLRALDHLSHCLDFELEFIALHGASPDASLPASIRIRSAGGSYVRLAILLWFSQLRRPASQVLIGHAKLLRSCFLSKLIFRQTRYRLFVHGIEVWPLDPAQRPKTISRALLNLTVNEVISVSRYTIKRMSALYRVSRYSLLPNAIDVPNDLETQPMAGARSGDRGPIILSVSRLASHDGPKGIDFALRAIAILRTHHPALAYRVVGAGTIREELERLVAELNLTDCVEFLGQLSDSRLEETFRSSDVFLLPSRKEGFGIVFLEAWKFGLPIVCGNLDASAEIVEDGVDGYTVDPCSPHAIAEAVEKLVSSEERRHEFATRGRRKVVARYSDRAFRENLGRLVSASEQIR